MLKSYSAKMPARPYRILISAGEASGDLHAANLVSELRRLNPQIEFNAIGGENLRLAGVHTIVDLADISVVGIWEVLAHIKPIWRALKTIRRFMQEQRPDLLVLLDCPGINLRLARTANKLGLKTIYYISPQIWAWHKSRIKIIRQCIDKMLVIFPFEEKFYRNGNVAVEYVGHPLADEVKTELDKTQTRKLFHIPEDHDIIALLPGSRQSEIKYLLPTHLAAARLLKQKNPKLTFILPLASSLKLDWLKPQLPADLNIIIVQNHKYEAISLANAAIVTSGTATLEVALLGIPLVIIYKVANLTYWLGRLLVKTPFMGLCNIVAEQSVAKELLQYAATPSAVAEEINALLYDLPYRQIKLQQLTLVKSKLGPGGCSFKVATIINDFLHASAIKR